MLNKSKVYIIDFDDSFTYNIANILYPLVPDIEVINYKLFFEIDMERITFNNKMGIILGPGPGHPNQYSAYFDKIKYLLYKPNIYLMGICLGHQLVAIQLGYKIITSAHPAHGEKIHFLWKDKECCVQRYNSLAVQPKYQTSELIWQNEVMILSYQNGQSFQFHPESVGTENPMYFFKDLVEYLHSS